MTHEIETIASDNNICGEGPIWDGMLRRLVWTDNEGGKLFQYVPAAGQKTIIHEGMNIFGIALCQSGGFVLASERGLVLWRGEGEFRLISEEHDGDAMVMNDIIAGPRGRIIGGTFYWGEEGMEKYGKLLAVDSDRSVRVLDEGVQLANGLGLSPDDSTLYFTDTMARKIYAYDYDARAGEVSNKRVFVDVPKDEGLADGLTVDVDGFVWSAHWYGSEVVRYDPDGMVERRIPLPATQISSLAFGGDDMNDLYITSAGGVWESDDAPAGYDFKVSNPGGSLYRVRTDIEGRLEHLADFAWDQAPPIDVTK